MDEMEDALAEFGAGVREWRHGRQWRPRGTAFEYMAGRCNRYRQDMLAYEMLVEV